MINIALKVGIETTSLAFWSSGLTIQPPRLPDETTIPTTTCLCGSWPERSMLPITIVNIWWMELCAYPTLWSDTALSYIILTLNCLLIEAYRMTHTSWHAPHDANCMTPSACYIPHTACHTSLIARCLLIEAYQMTHTSLPSPNNAEHPASKWQVYIFKSLVWFAKSEPPDLPMWETDTLLIQPFSLKYDKWSCMQVEHQPRHPQNNSWLY